MKILLPLSIFFVLLGNALFAAQENAAPESDQEEIITPDGEAPIVEAGLDLDGADLDGVALENIEGGSDENFVPSIRITEDLPVAFPIDI